jgi:hypothetical protein
MSSLKKDGYISIPQKCLNIDERESMNNSLETCLLLISPTHMLQVLHELKALII